MKKLLGKKMSTEAGTLVSYSCGCMCFAVCSCENTTYSYATVDYAQKYANNAQNDSKLLVVHM
jgi:hypothetical protein|uniref:Uncharacterized protein n=1 Tax=Eubacterium plexicaudatum ASF492 TaxID=1235802 RepID=N2A5F8_9FIRM